MKLSFDTIISLCTIVFPSCLFGSTRLVCHCEFSIIFIVRYSNDALPISNLTTNENLHASQYHLENKCNKKRKNLTIKV